MESVQKSFLGLFFLLLLTFLTTGIIAVQMQVCTARDYHADVINEIENSNFNAQVINACIRQAGENGYRMKVELYRDGDTVISADEQNVVSDTEHVYMAGVTMTYQYQFLFLEVDRQHTVRGFAKG